ncbi:MAG: hypothetical protein ACLU4N_22800 [Butyricimonas faecihominis]
MNPHFFMNTLNNFTP